MDIIGRGKKYAEGKALSALSSVIEQAYIDGYNDGLKHLEIEKLEAMKEGVEYVDLGLPSGTLWSSGCVKSSNVGIQRLSYLEATKLNIPTKEQYNELFSNCYKGFHYIQSSNPDGYLFTGINGNTVMVEFVEIVQIRSSKQMYFWLKEEDDSNERLSANNICENGNKAPNCEKVFMGLKLPVMLVKNK